MKELKIKFGLYISTFVFIGMLLGICLSAIYHIHEAENIRKGYKTTIDQLISIKNQEIKQLEKVADNAERQNGKLVDALHLKLNKQEIEELLNDIN